MTDRILAIDHIMVHVANSEEAGAVFERLGFIATPRSAMPGLSNRLICFGETPAQFGICNYIELMALEDPAAAPSQMSEILSSYGPVSTVMSIDDAPAVTKRLIAEGMKVLPAIDLERRWSLPNGDVVTLAFAVALPEFGQSPIYWNCCQHKTAFRYINPDFIDHPNGAKSFGETLALVDDPDIASAHYVRHWQANWDGERLTFGTGRPSLRLMSAHAARDLLSSLGADNSLGVKGVSIRVESLAKARAVVEMGGVTTISEPRGFFVRPDDAAGCLLFFEE